MLFKLFTRFHVEGLAEAVALTEKGKYKNFHRLIESLMLHRLVGDR